MKFRKKPVVVEADIYKEGMEDGFLLLFENVVIKDKERIEYWKKNAPQNMVPIIETLEGNHHISEGDYIITGVKGERYPCKPDIFEMTYEPLKEDIMSVKCEYCKDKKWIEIRGDFGMNNDWIECPYCKED